MGAYIYMNFFLKIIKKRKRIPIVLFDATIGKLIKNDRVFVSIRYAIAQHRFPNLDKPRFFQEKLQWLKLNCRDNRYTQMVDKYEAKKYVAEIIGDKYIIPTLGVWEKFEDIDFETLPNQFVLKCTHDSYGLYICKDKTSINIDELRKKFNKSLKRNYYSVGKEYPYKNVKSRIIAEKYMVDTNSGSIDLIDYKFFCFNGEPMYCQVIKDRNTHETIAFYDKEWQLQEFIGLNPMAHRATTPATKPVCYEEMLDIAQKLSKNIPFVRIDLYEINGRVYFGEITFFPNSGLGRFIPDSWNVTLGDLIKLPN